MYNSKSQINHVFSNRIECILFSLLVNDSPELVSFFNQNCPDGMWGMSMITHRKDLGSNQWRIIPFSGSDVPPYTYSEVSQFKVSVEITYSNGDTNGNNGMSVTKNIIASALVIPDELSEVIGNPLPLDINYPTIGKLHELFSYESMNYTNYYSQDDEYEPQPVMSFREGRARHNASYSNSASGTPVYDFISTPAPIPIGVDCDIMPSRVRSNCDCGRHLTEYEAYNFMGKSRCWECHSYMVNNRGACCACGQSHGIDFYNGTVEGFRFCDSCLSEYFDYCGNCGARGTLGSMHDRSLNGDREYLQCNQCYRPTWKTGNVSFPHSGNKIIPKGMTYGVELETHKCDGYQSLEGNTPWGCAREASTAGMEFISPVLSGDAGLCEIGVFLDENATGWEVNHECGTHVHISFDEWSIEEKTKVSFAFRCLEGWFKDLLPRRMDNGMCGTCEWTARDLIDGELDVEDFAANTDKFSWLNIRTLLRLNTIEIRLLYGTLNKELILKWIECICAIAAFAKNCTWHKLDRRFFERPLSTVSYILGADEELIKSLTAGEQYASIE